jgi:5-methylcytosine-specific restriction endonuclease McrA
MIRCKCGETNPNKMMNKGKGRISLSLCKECHNKNTIERGRTNKEIYIKYKGGKCERCNYNLCYEALDFHHIDPLEKDPNFSSIRYWGLEKAKNELDKCMLLCSRCHREKHAGIW